MSRAVRPLSVCLYTDVAPPGIGGAQTVLDCLARRLVAVGHRPIVLAPPARNTGDDRTLGYPIQRHRRQVSKRLGTRLVLPRLLLLHRRHRFDLVHCHAAYPQAHVAATFRRLSGVPFVVRPHGSDILPDDAIRRVPRLDRRMRRAIAGAAAVIAQGDYLRDVVAAAGVDPARIRVINNGVEVAAFARAAAHPHPRPYILGLGSLVPHKGFDLLVRGYAALPPDRPDLLIAGSGPELGALRRLADELGVGRQVLFLGTVVGDAKVSLYRSATFFVCPSRREPFANVILEAMAAGRPVVATDVGGNRELVHHGATGLLCPPESPAALAEAMQRLAANPAVGASMAAAAARVVGGYDWAAVADRYIDLYREVVAGGLVPAAGRGGVAA
jgi:glycosyltransferase involved in cell wall biosynthesis